LLFPERETELRAEVFGMSDPNTLPFMVCRFGITSFGMPESRDAAASKRFFGFFAAGFLEFLRFMLFAPRRLPCYFLIAFIVLHAFYKCKLQKARGFRIYFLQACVFPMH
jgi:hypothetical protein